MDAWQGHPALPVVVGRGWRTAYAAPALVTATGPALLRYGLLLAFGLSAALGDAIYREMGTGARRVRRVRRR
jgi:hypothetical protein